MRGIEQIPWLHDGLTALADPLGLVRWRRELVAGARRATLRELEVRILVHCYSRSHCTWRSARASG